MLARLLVLFVRANDLFWLFSFPFCRLLLVLVPLLLCERGRIDPHSLEIVLFFHDGKLHMAGHIALFILLLL